MSDEAETLTLANLDLPRRVARTLAARARACPDELYSAALVGLWRAATRYDPARHPCFRAWAARRCRGAALDRLAALAGGSRTTGTTRYPPRGGTARPLPLSGDPPDRPRADPRRHDPAHFPGRAWFDPEAWWWVERYFYRGWTLKELAAARGVSESAACLRVKTACRRARGRAVIPGGG